jgi:hypothetical protein
MTKRGSVLAAAAAAAFALGASGNALAGQSDEAAFTHHEKGEKMHCEGVNACKGKGECKTAANECGGLNACQGKGWVSMSQEECDAAKKAAKS